MLIKETTESYYFSKFELTDAGKIRMKILIRIFMDFSWRLYIYESEVFSNSETLKGSSIILDIENINYFFICFTFYSNFRFKQELRKKKVQFSNLLKNAVPHNLYGEKSFHINIK